MPDQLSPVVQRHSGDSNNNGATDLAGLIGGLDADQFGRDTRDMATGSAVPPGSLALSREIYASALDWYKVADSKGQLLLTLNGVYITALSSVTIA